MDKYYAIAAWIINASNSNYSLEQKCIKIAQYLEVLVQAAKEDDRDMIYQVIDSKSFTPPFPEGSDIHP